MWNMIKVLAQAVQITEGDIDVPKVELGTPNITNILRIVFGLAGGIALLIVTIGGFKYTISQGNPQETTKAKNTILYALIGLAVCITAFGIVQFVITEI